MPQELLAPRDEASHPEHEDFWDELLEGIQDQRVIPIVGADLLHVEVNGQSTLLDRYVAANLAEQFPPALDGLGPQPSLYAVVGRLLARRVKAPTICNKIHRIMAQVDFQPPAALVQLAQITHFNLFVTTDVSSLLEKALNQVSFAGGNGTESVVYSPKDARDLNYDYPGENHKQDWPTVYHLFGVHAPSPNYVFSEETLLEFIWALSGDRNVNRLFDALKNSSLLILGGNFPDWLARFLLRMARRVPLSQHRYANNQELVEILADAQSYEANLVLFLKQYSANAKVVSRHGGTVEFIHELRKRWGERNPNPPARHWPPPPEASMPEGAVFISYASEDRPAVQKLKDGLESSGVPVWFDRSDLRSGDEWDAEIKVAIERCSCFVVVLSQHVQRPGERYFLQEWSMALERSQRFPSSFIFPVVIDGNIDFGANPPRQLTQILKSQTTQMGEGKVTPEFVQIIRKAMDQNRRNPRLS